MVLWFGGNSGQPGVSFGSEGEPDRDRGSTWLTVERNI